MRDAYTQRACQQIRRVFRANGDRHSVRVFACETRVVRDRTLCSTKRGDSSVSRPAHAGGDEAYFADANPSAHENSRNSSFGADTFLYVRTEVKGSTSAFGSVTVIRSSRMPGDVNLMRSRTVN